MGFTLLEPRACSPRMVRGQQRSQPGDMRDGSVPRSVYRDIYTRWCIPCYIPWVVYPATYPGWYIPLHTQGGIHASHTQGGIHASHTQGVYSLPVYLRVCIACPRTSGWCTRAYLRVVYPCIPQGVVPVRRYLRVWSLCVGTSGWCTVGYIPQGGVPWCTYLRVWYTLRRVVPFFLSSLGEMRHREASLSSPVSLLDTASPPSSSVLSTVSAPFLPV